LQIAQAVSNFVSFWRWCK